MQVSNLFKNKNKIIGLGAVVLAIALVLLLKEPPKKETPPVQKTEAEVVDDVVMNFGRRLHLVSLLADKTVLNNALAGHYGPYVSTTLITKWQKNHADAPGRAVSSPWPDRIEIDSTVKNEDASYTVKARVVEITSTGIADQYGVTITLKNQYGKWFITDYKKDPAPEAATSK